MRLWELVQGPLYHVGQERQICTESVVRASVNAVTEAWTHTVRERGPQLPAGTHKVLALVIRRDEK